MSKFQELHAEHAEELWLPVVGWEDGYSVSNHGNVRSENRELIRQDGHRRMLPGRPIRPTAMPRTGHLRVGLCRSSSRINAPVHRLVLEAFVGPRPDGHVGRHLDDNPANNHLSNLAWGTVSDNAHDCVRNGNHNNASKTRCLRGHELAQWNLTSYSRTTGYRYCLACSKARRQVRHANGVGDLDQLADRHFAALLAAAAKAEGKS